MRRLIRDRIPRYFLKRSESKQLGRRVASFEESTACELVFHFRRRPGPDPLKFNQYLFHKFKLDQTERRTGILITLALKDRNFAVWADEAVVRQAKDHLWKEVTDLLGTRLKEGKRLEALLDLIAHIETCLAKEQPPDPSYRGPRNELKNEPIVEKE